MSIQIKTLSFLLVVALIGMTWAQTRQQSTAPWHNSVMTFVNVKAIPMDRERILEDQTVIVRDGRIAEIGPAGAIKVPKDALTVDGRGRYLMPGLADFHIHLHSTDHLLSYLAYGVTSVFDLDGDPESLQLRAAIAGGDRLGPNYYTCGPRTDGNPPIFPGGEVVAIPEEARRAVAGQKRAGYDAVKVYNNLTPDVYAALVEEAKKQGIPVVGHVPRKVGVEAILRSGQAMIAHGEEYFFTYFRGPADSQNKPGAVSQPDVSKIPGIAQATRAAGTAVIPNLSFIANTRRMLENLSGVLTDPETKYLTPAVLRRWQSNNPTRRRDLEQFTAREKVKYPFVQQLTKGLHDAGVILLLGTDASAPGCFPGQSAHLELRELVAAGLTPYQALATGTRSPGQFIAGRVRSGEKFGIIAVGQRADLLLLAANPLEKIDNISSLIGVMVRGRWLPKATIQQMREEQAASYGNRN